MIHPFDMSQDIERVLVSEAEIHTRLVELGQELSRDYAGKKPIFVGVLKGVVPFFAEMARCIQIPPAS